MARPGLELGRRRRLELREGVARAAHVVEAQRGPAARVQAPHREVGGSRTTGHLPEERVGLLESIEAVVGLGEPVARLGQEVAFLPAAHGGLEILHGVVVLALGEVGAAALERLRGDAERRADARERARRRDGRRGLGGDRREDRRQGHCRELRRRRRQGQIDDCDRRLLDRRLGERHERREVRRRGRQRKEGRGESRDRPRAQRGEQEDGRRQPAPHDFFSPLGAGLPGCGCALTAAARSRAQLRSVASGLLVATASYAARAARISPSCSLARPRPASAR